MMASGFRAQAMSSDTTDFHPGYLHPDTLEIMQGDNRLLGHHHDHHPASQRHREALWEHSPAVTPMLTPRAVLSSAMLVSAVDGGNVLTVGSESRLTVSGAFLAASATRASAG